MRARIMPSFGRLNSTAALLIILQLASPRPGQARPPSAEPVSLAVMEAEISSNNLPGITGVLLSRSNSIVYEKYFGTGGREKLNDTRSVTKSITALAVGCAIHDGRIPEVDLKILPLFKDLAPFANSNAVKGDIRLKDLLTMGSALDADDSVQDSPGNEDRMHEQNSWTRWAVDLPVRKEAVRDTNGCGPFHYATVNAFLAGQVLQRATGQPVDGYITETILKPLGIQNYLFQKSPAGEIMTGGGLQLRGVDLLKIGQLVLDHGHYQGRQIIPESWVNDCLTIHQPQTVGPGIGYGFLFWHLDFPVGDHAESGWFMAGNGGNIVVIFPAIKSAAVVTRTDYNGRNTAGQTIRLMSQFILPALKER